jgi:uncharacterized membrane protein YagU involved in acid resistance
MFEEKGVSISQIRHPLLVGIAAGVIAGVVTGRADRLMDRLVSKRQKRREHIVREASPHQLAGPYFAQKLTGKRWLTRKEKERAKLAFGVAYGVGWGLIHSSLRKKFPALSRLAGLPFAVPFFFACDGMIAPLLGISPNLRRIPWQPSLKEMGNHLAWTATAECIHRLAEHAGGNPLPSTTSTSSMSST